MDVVSQLAGTVLLRPYFVAFLCAYFVACTLHLGAARACAFAVVGFLIAWISEVSSIRHGIPFGYYYYVDDTRGRELWLAGVPFMDSMSFVFLSYAAFSMALMVVTPAIRNGGIYLLETNRVRHSLKARLLGALFFVYLDIIIDPLALQGQRWFLGRIYGYPDGGAYFGVPIANFAGWFVVGFVLIWVLQLIDRLMLKLRINDFAPPHRYRYMFGPALYAGIICFNLFVTLIIRDYHLLWAGIFIALLPVSLIVVKWTTPRTSAEAVDEHLRDFPQPAVIRKMISEDDGGL